MQLIVLLILKTLVVIIQCNDISNDMPFTVPILTAYPCNDSKDIIVWYDPALPPKQRNQYYLYANRGFPRKANIEVKFNADVNIIMVMRTANNTFEPYSLKNGEEFTQRYHTSNPSLLNYGYKVKGTSPGSIPYVTSFKLNNVELCKQPNVGFLDVHAANTVDAETRQNCGRRKIQHIELIVNGAQTKSGDWPWHTAIYKFEYSTIKYICGGSLLSIHFVLTAAHCVSKGGVPVLPEILSVVLGKYNLYGGDIGSEEREVHRIIIHDKFKHRHLRNDIALMKLKTEVVFTDYIQPACLWYHKASEKLLTDTIVGTIVGWGFDINGTLSRTIKQAEMPMVPDNVCIASNPHVYTSFLNSKNFCAGYRNNTSACNGDSGGAFQVFVPDSLRQTVDTHSSGTWLVRGIVSGTVAKDGENICDPQQYVVFTDVAKYLTWIQNNLDDA